jgi:hypothetical protein
MRVRAVEHQLAKLRLATADNRLLSLTQVGDRIDSLRAQIFAEPGATDGLTLRSMGEMATRLDTARSDMTVPIAVADAHRDEMDIRRRAAWAREEGADRLHARASNAETISAERRADANRPGKLSNARNRIPLS